MIPQRRMLGVFDHRCGQVGTCVEQVVLDLDQYFLGGFVGRPSQPPTPMAAFTSSPVGVGDQSGVAFSTRRITQTRLPSSPVRR